MKRGYCYEYYQRLAPYANWRYEYVYGSFPELPMGQARYIFLKRSWDSSITENPASFNGKRLGTVSGIVESSLREFVKQQHLWTGQYGGRHSSLAGGDGGCGAGGENPGYLQELQQLFRHGGGPA